MPQHPRVQVQGPERIPLQPQARPVNVPVVRRRAEINLGNLAGALAPFAQGLADLSGKLGAVRDEREIRRGEEAARALLAELQGNARLAARRLRAGDIWAHESGAFIKGARAFLGQAVAANLHREFPQWLSKSGLANSEDPHEIYGAWLQNVESTLAGIGPELNSDFLDEFRRTSNNSNQQILEMVGGRADRNLRNSLLRDLESAGTTLMKELFRLPQLGRGGEIIDPPTFEEIGAAFTVMLDKHFAMGANMKEHNERVKLIVQRVAEQFKRPDFLRVLRHIRTQGKNTLWTTALVDGTLKATGDRIYTAMEATAGRARVQADAIRQQRGDAIVASMMTAIDEDAGTDISVFRRQMVGVDVQRADELVGIRNKLIAEDASISKPNEVRELIEKVWDDTEPLTLAQLVDMVAEDELNKADRDEVIASFKVVRDPALSTFAQQGKEAIGQQARILEIEYLGVTDISERFSPTIPEAERRGAGVAVNLLRIHGRQMLEALEGKPIPISEFNQRLAQEAQRIRTLVPKRLTEAQQGNYFGPRAWEEDGMDIGTYHSFIDEWSEGGFRWGAEAEKYFLARNLTDPTLIYEFMDMPKMVEAAREDAAIHARRRELGQQKP